MRLILLTSLLLASTAQADVLFLDMNNAGTNLSNCASEKSEICGAWRAAKQRGEKLVVIPRDIDANTRRKIEAISKPLNAAKDQMDTLKCSKNPSPRCHQLTKEHAELLKKRDVETKDFAMNEARLKKELELLDKQGTKISTLIVSAHDGNNQIDGDFGTLKNSELAWAFGSVPNLTNGIEALFLWGCYTTSMGNLDGHWKNVFPNARVADGFDGKAPLKHDPNSYDHLEKKLEVEGLLKNVQSQQQLKDVLKKVPHFFARESAICVGDWYATPIPGTKDVNIRDLADVRKCRMEGKTKELYDIYHCYREAKPGMTKLPSGKTLNCENPPGNTSVGQPLRDFWKVVNGLTADCEEYWKNTELEIPHPNAVRGLLFYKDVQHNVQQLHKDDLKKIDENLAKAGLKDLKVSDLPSMKRSDVIARLAEIEAKLKNVPSSLERDYLQTQISAVGGVLSGLHEIPSDWHGASATKSEILSSLTSANGKQGVEIDHEGDRISSMMAPIEKKIKNESNSGKRVEELQKELRKYLDSQDQPKVAETMSKIREAKNSANSGSTKENLVRAAEKQRDSQGSLSSAQKAAWESYIYNLKNRP